MSEFWLYLLLPCACQDVIFSVNAAAGASASYQQNMVSLVRSGEYSESSSEPESNGGLVIALPQAPARNVAQESAADAKPSPTSTPQREPPTTSAAKVNNFSPDPSLPSQQAVYLVPACGDFVRFVGGLSFNMDDVSTDQPDAIAKANEYVAKYEVLLKSIFGELHSRMTLVP